MSSQADIRRHQISGAATTDRFWIDTRDANNASRYFITNPSGAPVSCLTNMRPCEARGSATYQVITWPSTAISTPLPYRVDTWRLNTGTGLPGECKTVPSVGYGFGPLTGALTDTQPGTCVAMTVGDTDHFTVTVRNSDGATAAPMPMMVTSREIEPCHNGAGGEYSCGFFLSTGETEKVLLVLYSGDTVGRIPYRVEATCDQPLCGREQFAVASITPAAARTGTTVTITLKGTALHTRDTVQLASANRPTATVRTVTPDRTPSPPRSTSGSHPRASATSSSNHTQAKPPDDQPHSRFKPARPHNTPAPEPARSHRRAEKRTTFPARRPPREPGTASIALLKDNLGTEGSAVPVCVLDACTRVFRRARDAPAVFGGDTTSN